MSCPCVLLAFAALLYLMRPGMLRVVVAAAPIVVLYLSMELYYMFLHSIVKLDDLLLLPEGLIVSPLWIQVGFWLGLSLLGADLPAAAQAKTAAAAAARPAPACRLDCRPLPPSRPRAPS